MRVGALAVLWAPAAVLVTAALEPGAAVEYAAIALLCLALGALERRAAAVAARAARAGGRVACSRS